MPIVISPTKKKKTPMPKARPKSLKADKTESLDKKFSAGVSATNKKNMQNVKKKKDDNVSKDANKKSFDFNKSFDFSSDKKKSNGDNKKEE